MHHTPSPLEVQLGKEVRRRRTRLRMTQMLLGKQIGVDATTIGRIEAAEVAVTVGRLAELADALGVHPYHLLVSTDEDIRRHQKAHNRTIRAGIEALQGLLVSEEVI